MNDILFKNIFLENFLTVSKIYTFHYQCLKKSFGKLFEILNKNNFYFFKKFFSFPVA